MKGQAQQIKRNSLVPKLQLGNLFREAHNASISEFFHYTGEAGAFSKGGSQAGAWEPAKRTALGDLLSW
ncbi:MAG: hypothetical protein C4519_25440 [Desulfobacteraceae bacterium]|nr:MAG: hypothetical protein C4519_25440 [Desulfobacteraceae bacterium]